MNTFSILVSSVMLGQTLRMALPYVGAALGGIWSERSGVVNIALEGILLVSGFFSIAVELATGSAIFGATAGIAAGALFGLLHAWLVVRRKIDAIVSGIALNLIALGATRFLLRAFYGSSSNSPSVSGSQEAANALVAALIDPLFVVTLIAIAASHFALVRTRFGLRVRASGESPAAARTAGLDVARIRMGAVSLGAALCGVGGVALAAEQHQFQSGMSGGRGFIALAAVIVSGWRPVRAALACVVFALLDALQIVLQDKVAIPHELLSMIPYGATLVALALLSKFKFGAPAPAGIGVDEEAEA